MLLKKLVGSVAVAMLLGAGFAGPSLAQDAAAAPASASS